jgi:hypothetical protein
MSQRHLIRRQIIELTVPDRATAQRLKPIVSALVRDQLGPLLERVFDAAVGAREVRRIDRLELDLGVIDMASFGDQLMLRAAAALPPAVRRAIALPDDVAADALAAIGRFARTGVLGWWSSTREPLPVEETVEVARRTAPGELGRLIRSLASDRTALERLIAHLSDAALERLVAIVVPDAIGLVRTLPPRLAQIPATAGLTPARRRLALWSAALNAGAAPAVSLEETVLAAIATAAATTIDPLRNDLQRLGERPGKRADDRADLAPLSARLRPPAAGAAGAAVPAVTPQRPAVGDDDRAVDTAGLCLLWPFMARFFARLTLLDPSERAFADPASRHRAALMLHHVATGAAEGLDHALALPKALCGLALHVPHQAACPVTDAEAAEARGLVDAVIAHATSLGDMTTDEFRAGFMARSGMLATRDGAWLLRVERELRDVVLDHLPWRTQWIRLPWMEAPMRVEW